MCVCVGVCVWVCVWVCVCVLGGEPFRVQDFAGLSLFSGGFSGLKVFLGVHNADLLGSFRLT